MSEKDNTDEAAQTENQSSLNRRRFVKALGTTGVASVGLSSAVAGKRNTNSGEPVGLSQGKTMKAFGHAMSGQATNQLKKYLTDDGYQQDPSDVTAVAVESDKPELNNGNPVSVFIPFKGKQGDLDKTGFINVLVVDAEPNGRSGKRVPVAAFGLSSEPSRGSSAELEQMPDDGVTHHVEYFSWNGETEQVATAGKQDFTKSDVIEAYDQVAGSQDQISTQGFFDPPSIGNILSAGACLLLVRAICEQAGSGASIYTCSQICLSTSGLGPIGYVGCNAACVAIIEVIGFYGCGGGAGFICGALGFSV